MQVIYRSTCSGPKFSPKSLLEPRKTCICLVPKKKEKEKKKDKKKAKDGKIAKKSDKAKKDKKLKIKLSLKEQAIGSDGTESD